MTSEAPQEPSKISDQFNNRFELDAQLLERGVMRYTPAGLPALDLSLQHESLQKEDGTSRKVCMQIKAVALGVITRQLAALDLGSVNSYEGFLTNQRNGRGVIFHITAWKPINLP